MRRFQVIDEDFNEMGILETNLSKDIVQLEWSHYVEFNPSENFCIEEFIDLMSEAYPANYFGRVFLDGIIDPFENYISNYESKINLKKKSNEK